MESNIHQDEIPTAVSFGNAASCAIIELMSAQCLLFDNIRNTYSKITD